ncbi:hypothetical protein PRIPAC_80686 [Pristionchus pacificus]|uniref:Nuclear receptor n=1 Tax=Pristionchus pacificus TaxID=54126 RepID=A0A2A6CLE1_PRIPA|nr:hypothetical protein PRIPAC_80686 [Pristionchus pacificus]|eukprot:PDM78920.1 nuclear receptor [Pristionchus pacificus]
MDVVAVKEECPATPPSFYPATKVYRCRNTLDSNCTVCDKPATGTHYSAVSCNGCRSFFRRSIALGKLYNCKRTGSNQLECFLRHRCKHCRLVLCRSAGMNSDAVQKEDEMNAEYDYDCDLPDVQEVALIRQPPQLELRLEGMMKNMLAIEDAHERLRISAYCPRLVEGLTVDDVTAGPSKLGMNFGPMRSQPFELESIRLVPPEFMIKNPVVIDFSDFDYSTRKLWVFQDICYAMEYIKALSIFHLLDDCSKRVLLASAMACTNLTAAYFSYTQHADRTVYPDGGTMTWSKQVQDLSPETCRQHTAIIAAIKDAKLDKREYTLLKVILVCNPLLEGMSPHDVTLLQHEKERCTKTLLSYVLARRGVKEGPSAFAKILSIVDVITRITSWEKGQHIVVLAMGLWKHRIPFTESIFHSH